MFQLNKVYSSVCINLIHLNLFYISKDSTGSLSTKKNLFCGFKKTNTTTTATKLIFHYICISNKLSCRF